MVGFINATIKKVIKIKNKVYGEIKTSYILDLEDIDVCLRPISNKEKTKDWGLDIKSNKKIYCDTELEVGDLIYCKGKVYEIEDVFDNRYALLESDVKINEDNK
ncbi:MAG: hypothetical protein E7K85_04785 [Clostridium sp.]|uniref:hypothetical protein n=1 Tax=Clostridium TaxID=1485 RepID=UPI00232F388D|nr:MULTISPECIES: hypothetical protein [Clostridium]MDB2119611.1 hypothetical protein [Clostridium paraputrificum]MDU2754193.1 hypothetical protein [Clostridium sp.]MDU2899922.1 hypothetical protein [Clostridium sp.]MDU4426870.1 hypothetical protein [Clostridium sp.]MDU5741240.1 hypothetical protein [Clostridium sp.]